MSSLTISNSTITIILSSLALLWSRLPVYVDHAALVLVVCGLMHSLNVARLIVCSLTKVKESEMMIKIYTYKYTRI